jgi:hypothetical protein
MHTAIDEHVNSNRRSRQILKSQAIVFDTFTTRLDRIICGTNAENTLSLTISLK